MFCSKSLQVAKKYLTLANQLHVKHDVCLSKMILASLYESLGDGVTQLNNLGGKGNLILSCPFWLLQLWLNATFEASLPNKGFVDEEVEEVKNRGIEGIRLAQLTLNHEGQALRPTFMSYIMMFANRHVFHIEHGPLRCQEVWSIMIYKALSISL